MFWPPNQSVAERAFAGRTAPVRRPWRRRWSPDAPGSGPARAAQISREQQLPQAAAGAHLLRYTPRGTRAGRAPALCRWATKRRGITSRRSRVRKTQQGKWRPYCWPQSLSQAAPAPPTR